MADRSMMPVAELFATLGLESSGLSEGLSNAEISVKDFLGIFNELTRNYKQSMKMMSEAGVAAAAAVAQAADGGISKMIEIDAATRKYIATQERFEAQSIRMKAAYAQAMAERAAAEKVWMTGLHGALEGKQTQQTGQYDVVDASIARAGREREAIAERTAIQESRAAELAEKRAFDAEFQVLLNQERAQRVEQAALEAESNAEERRISQQLAAIQAEDVVSRREYANLINQLAVQQAEADASIAAEQEAAFRTQMEMLNSRLVARRAEIAEERYLEQQAMEARRSQAAAGVTSAGSGGGFASVGLRMGSGGITPNVRVGQFLNQALLGPAMDVILPIALMDAAVSMVDVYGKKISEVVDDLQGFGKANRDAWMEAYEGAERAQTAAAQYMERLVRVAGSGLKGQKKYATEADEQKAVLADLEMRIKGRQEEAAKLDASIALLRANTPESQVKYPSTQAGELRHLQDIQDKDLANAKLEDLLKQRDAIINRVDPQKGELADLLKRRGEEELKLKELNNKSLMENTHALRKWHDDYHELPNRLPWFMGGGLTGSDGKPLPSYVGPGFIGGTASISKPLVDQATPSAASPVNLPTLPNPTGGTGVMKAPTGKIMPTQSPMESIPAPSQTPRASSQPSKTPAASGITINIANNPTFQFSGVPDFMRDVIEPKLVKDMDQNSRGIAKQIADALKKQGVVVR